VRVRVSDPERTVVDALINPIWMGGVRHLADVLLAYKDSDGASATKLAEALRRHGNGAAHKRAGWLAEQLWPDASALLTRARVGKTSGVIKLDPAVARRGRMNRRWGLWINATVAVPRERS
jgi:predicted transcriptional regulator of viral defense system